MQLCELPRFLGGNNVFSMCGMYTGTNSNHYSSLLFYPYIKHGVSRDSKLYFPNYLFILISPCKDRGKTSRNSNNRTFQFATEQLVGIFGGIYTQVSQEQKGRGGMRRGDLKAYKFLGKEGPPYLQ